MNRNRRYNGNGWSDIVDYGPDPFVVNIDRAAKLNQNYRTVLWTGNEMQVTLMSIPVGGDIGIEVHEDIDQFIRVESGEAFVMMGQSQNALTNRRRINSNYAVIIPAGTYHNIMNTGRTPLKLYSIYAPPKHPFGTVHPTKADAMYAE